MYVRIHILLLALLALSGCKKDDDVLSQQQDQLVQFLTGGNHVPKLVSLDVANESIERLDFYTTEGNTAYRYIRRYYDPDRDNRPQVEKGDSVTLTYWIYYFNNQPIIDPGPDGGTRPVWTNDPTLNMGNKIDLDYWPAEPLPVKVGAGEILRGVDLSLPDCRERDTVEVYMTYEMAYGATEIGIIPAKSPIAFFCVIENVKKQ
jgi:hypothetical protein